MTASTVHIGPETRCPGIDAAHRRVIFASSLGTVSACYGLHLYGTLVAAMTGVIRPVFLRETKDVDIRS